VAATVLWRHRDRLLATGLLAASVVVAAVWEFVLLDRTPTWLPWLRYAILMAGVASAVLLLVVSRLVRQVGLMVAATALVAALAGPSAYAVSTARTPHAGSIPSAGPASAAGFGGPGGRFNGQRPGGFPPPGAGQVPNGAPGGGFPPGQAPGGAGGGPTGGAGGAPTGGVGGLLNASTPSAEVVTALTANSSQYTWVAAAVGSNSAAGFQLATEKPVMAIGGFNGSDPSPTLDQFKALVAAGKIHYFISGGALGAGRGPGGAQNGGSNASAQISSWVQSNFTSVTVDGTILYDLAQPAG
jgi:hypothetical protein